MEIPDTVVAVPEAKVEAKLEPKIEPKVDLVTRVSQVKVEPKPEPETIFNVNDINAIEDPKAKEYATKAYKSLQGDYTRKSQALAEERKRWEAEKAQKEHWNVDKVQSLLTDPEFIQAAQGIVGAQQAEDTSILSDTEKKRIADIENLARMAVQQNATLLKKQQDETLKSKYANYNPQAIDILTADMIQGKVQATREHLHKVLDYDDAIQRAYELGKSDRKLETEEKVNALSPEGMTVTGNESIPAPEQGESSKNYFMRLANKRMAEFAKGKVLK